MARATPLVSSHQAPTDMEVWLNHPRELTRYRSQPPRGFTPPPAPEEWLPEQLRKSTLHSTALHMPHGCPSTFLNTAPTLRQSYTQVFRCLRAQTPRWRPGPSLIRRELSSQDLPTVRISMPIQIRTHSLNTGSAPWWGVALRSPGLPLSFTYTSPSRAFYFSLVLDEPLEAGYWVLHSLYKITEPWSVPCT